MSDPTKVIRFANGQQFNVSGVDPKDIEDQNSEFRQWVKRQEQEWGAAALKTPDAERMIMLPSAGTPGSPVIPPVSESTYRTVTNLIGEAVPFMLPGGVLKAAPKAAQALGIFGRATMPSIGHKLISEPLQRAAGVEPEPFGLKEAATLGALEMGGEAVAQGGSKLLRGTAGVIGRRFGRATPDQAKRIRQLYNENGIERPPLSSVRESQMARGVYGYLQKSLWSAGLTLDNLLKLDEEILQTAMQKTAKPGYATLGYTAAEAGESLEYGARRVIRKEFDAADELYAGFRSVKPENLPVRLTNTRAISDERIYRSTREIAEAYGGTKMTRGAAKMDRAMSRGEPIVFEDLERMRSFLGDMMSRTPNRKERAELEWLYGALTDDMEAALELAAREGRAAPEAVSKWRAARARYQRAIQKSDDFWSDLLNKVSPEEVTAQIEGYISGDTPRLSRLRAVRSELTDAEWEPFRDYWLRKMLVSPDGQHFLGFPHLVEQTKNLTNEAKDILFGQGTPLRKEFDSLIALGEHYTGFGPRTVDPSTLMTASEIVGPAATGLGIVTAGGGVFPAMLAAITYPLGVNSLARLIQSPAFVKWTVEGAKIAPNGIAAHMGGLAGIAANESPEIRNIILEMIQNSEAALEDPKQGPIPMTGAGLIAGR